MDREFLVFGPDTARAEFEGIAIDIGFSVRSNSMVALSAGPVNAVECLQLAFSKEGAAIFIALASVIRAYLSAKSSRRITITKLDHNKIGAIDARGYSKEELAELLPRCRELIVYDNKPKKPKT